jgi:hypothetical protein
METNVTYHDDPDPCLISNKYSYFTGMAPKKDLPNFLYFLWMLILDAPASSRPRICSWVLPIEAFISRVTTELGVVES